MTNQRSPLNIAHKLALALLIGALLTLSSCVPDVFGPTITDVTVDPSTIAKSNTGMTDEYFDVTISTSGFEGEFESAEVFIQVPDGAPIDSLGSFRTAEDGDISTIINENQTIATSWFGDVEAGTYNIGARVTTDLEEVTQRDLATVTVTDN